MRVQVLLPVGVFFESIVLEIVAEGPSGSFGILPRHMDTCSPLSPGILKLRLESGKMKYIAVFSGILLKIGSEVRIVSQKAFLSDDFDTLATKIREELQKKKWESEKEKSVIAKLELSFAKKFFEMSR